MNRLPQRFCIAILTVLAVSGANLIAQPTTKDNQLTKKEVRQGWKLLFDGQTTNGWHNYLKNSISGWKAENGMLLTTGKNGDIVTDEVYDNFELSVDWKIEKQGNSGIFYFIVEEPVNARMHQSGPEFQIIDNDNYPQKLNDNQVTGSASDVLKPSAHTAKPIGEWNTTIIKSKNGKIQHWLNGKKILDFDMHSNEWKEAVKQSKFAEFNYAQTTKGKIGLQDHGNFVAFKNIKIRRM